MKQPLKSKNTPLSSCYSSICQNSFDLWQHLSLIHDFHLEKIPWCFWVNWTEEYGQSHFKVRWWCVSLRPVILAAYTYPALVTEFSVCMPKIFLISVSNQQSSLFVCFLFVWALDYSSDGSSLRDITSSPREVCSRVCNRISRLATFPDWPHSSRQVVLPGNMGGILRPVQS